ncbi:hypothetical protein T492DRAFT_57341 [Pavlovales sp. CCMP2436]|nr:hypothetical protein T492DRAFT_57341 [Pavlovales sp. CCMP2436]|mmetsp:Transcript_13047/g.33131  ORF Transcript_13047/g.33131 Transcript_13047/m.33131 type:complete len:374 (+) Transcript_13047:113-1234(+)
MHHAAPLLAIVASALGFSIQALCVKTIMLEGGCGIFQLIFWRGIVLGLCCLAALAWLGVPVREFAGREAVHMRMNGLRGIAGFCALAFIFSAIALLPLGDQATLAQTASLWAGLMAWCLLGERWRPIEFICALGGLLGVAIMLRPDMLYDGSEAAQRAPSVVADPTGEAQRILGVVYALTGTLFAGASFVSLRWLGSQVATPIPSVILSQGVAQALLAPIFVVATGESWRTPTASQGVRLVLIGLFGFATQVVLTWGMQREKAAVTAPLRTFEVLFAFVFQATLVPAPVQASSVVGAVVICGSMLVNVFAREATLVREEAPFAKRVEGVDAHEHRPFQSFVDEDGGIDYGRGANGTAEAIFTDARSPDQRELV